MWEAKREEREKREKGIKKETEREGGGEREGKRDRLGCTRMKLPTRKASVAKFGETRNLFSTQLGLECVCVCEGDERPSNQDDAGLWWREWR